MAARWSNAYPELNEGTGITISAAGGVHPFIARAVRAFLALMMGMVAVVLLVACANVANLMLARVASRLRETALRAALGAGRWRIAGSFLLEGALVALLGGAGGILLSIWATRFLSGLRPDVGIPVSLDAGVDMRVLVFALMVTALTAVLFSAGPALRAANARVFDQLREAGAAGGVTRSRGRATLVVMQVAMCTVLLFGASLLVRSLQRSRVLDSGFDPSNVLVITASPELLGLDETRGRAFWQEYAMRVGRIPGVSAAALALFVPMGDRGDAIGAGPFEAPAGEASRVPYNYITPGYFDLLRIPLSRGRDFQDSDVETGPAVAIVSQAMAKRLWPDEDPIGHRLRILEGADQGRIATVVGVANDIALSSPGEAPRPLLYLPFSQWYRPDMMLHVRADAATGLAAALETELRNTLPGLPARIRTMTEATSFALIPLRVASSVLGVSGLIGLILAATGIFGLIAYIVSRQARDIAIRMALGAERRRVRQMVLARALRLTLIGLAAGILTAILAAQLIRSMLFGVTPADPIALTGVVLTFTVVSILAAWVPARRASAVDPARLLRE
jgi:predicted permease